MDEGKDTPLLFADKVVRKFVDNLLGKDVDSAKLGAIRVVFRRCGGEWSSVLAGDPVHIGLLIRLVQAWGNLNIEKSDAS